MLLNSVAAGFSVTVPDQPIFSGGWHFGEQARQMFCGTFTGASNKAMFERDLM